MIQVLQKFPKPWGIINNDVGQKKSSQRHEKHNKVSQDNPDGQENAISETHGFLQGGTGDWLVRSVPIPSF
jgi:hypothetical protein